MSIKAYYNEIETYCCAWLSNLMDAGLITPGVIDDRSIEDVRPRDLDGFDRVHFFAGVGVWDYALNQARWGTRPIWTGSCPCQPFSEAGKGTGFADKRHLWPYWLWLIEQCGPPEVHGEQVASKNAGAWIDLVQDDMEALGYAFGAVPFPACGVGSHHIRERTYWGANSHQHGGGRKAKPAHYARTQAIRSTDRTGRHSRIPDWPRSGVEWTACADGKTRPTEPGIPVLVNEYPGRVDQLRAFGNAIDAEAARIYIECVMDTTTPLDLTCTM